MMPREIDNPMYTNPHWCHRCGVDLLNGNLCGECERELEDQDRYPGCEADIAADEAEE